MERGIEEGLWEWDIEGGVSKEGYGRRGIEREGHEKEYRRGKI